MFGHPHTSPPPCPGAQTGILDRDLGPGSRTIKGEGTHIIPSPLAGEGKGEGDRSCPYRKRAVVTRRRALVDDVKACSLEVVKGVRVGEGFSFSQEIIRLGRSAENDLVVNDSAVSRQHAEIAMDPRSGRWRIRDLGSQNGVFVNGNKIAERELESEDRVGIGEHEFRFLCAVPSAVAAEPDRTVAVPAAGVAGGGQKPVSKAKEAAPKTVGGQSLFRKPLVLGAAGIVLLLLLLSVLLLPSKKPSAPSLPPQSREPVPLPAKGAFGFIPFKGADKSHADKVDFTFVAKSKKLEMTYSTAGIERPGEVLVYLNGFKIGEADVKTDWTFPRTATLPSEYIILNGTNTLTFDSTLNPPQVDAWGVRQVSVVDWGADPCDGAKGAELFNLGKTKVETKLVAPDNLVRGYDALRQAMRHWEQCPSRPADYAKAEEMAASAGQEIDEKIKKMLLDAESAIRIEQHRSALQTLAELGKMFYDPADPRQVFINEKGERTFGMMEQTKGKKKR